MSDQELNLLEEKIDNILRYCGQLESKRDDLLRQTQEQSSQINELEGKLARFEEERENVRLRVSELLGKIDQIDAFPKEFEDTGTATQIVAPLDV